MPKRRWISKFILPISSVEMKIGLNCWVFFCSGIQLYVLVSPYISLFYLLFISRFICTRR